LKNKKSFIPKKNNFEAVVNIKTKKPCLPTQFSVKVLGYPARIRYMISPVTGKNSNNCRITRVLSQHSLHTVLPCLTLQCSSSSTSFFLAARHSVFLYYIAPFILFFEHHFKDWLIPTFMVVTILILIGIIIFTTFFIVYLLLTFIVGHFQ
jgi:hypothetical protein